VLSHGKGSYVWDTEGRKYLDFAAGIAVNALGHADEDFVKVNLSLGSCLGEHCGIADNFRSILEEFHADHSVYIQAIKNQAGKLIHTSNVYHNEWAGKLAKLIITLTQKQGGLGWTAGSEVGGAKVFFTSSGTEANEGALKISRSIGKARWASSAPGRSWDSQECTKTRIVCFENAFHGRSMGSLSVTTNPKYQKPFEPLIPGVDVGKLNIMEDLERLIGEDVCAVIVEPVQGEGGVSTANIEWLMALRKKCSEVGAVLIFDEIQASATKSDAGYTLTFIQCSVVCTAPGPYGLIRRYQLNVILIW
jgi:acetylornithine aminotransferase